MGELKAKFFIKGEENPEFAHDKWDELNLVAKFERGALQASLSDGVSVGATTITLHREGAKRVVSHIQGGLDLTTGGVFEGIPYDYVFEQDGTNLKLEYYIDLTKPHKIWDDTHGLKVECQIVKRKSLDWLDEKAGAISFAYLYDIKELTDDLINFVEYVVERKIEPFKIFLISFTFIFIIQMLRQIVKELIKWIAKVLGVFPAIEAIIILFPILLDIFTTVLAIISLIKAISEYLNIGGRRHNGAYVNDLLTVASNHMGLNFKSTIFQGEYRNAFILPSKDDKGYTSLGSGEDNKGYPGVNSPVYNFKNMLNVLLDMFNSRPRIIGQTLHLERRDFWRSMTSYTLPSCRLPAYSYNTSELAASYIIWYSKDPSDLNTMEDVAVLNYQSTTEPKTKVEQDLNLLNGITEKTIPFSFGFRKEELNGWQTAWNIITSPFIAVANAVNSAIFQVRKKAKKATKFFNKLGKLLKLVGIKTNANQGNDPGDPPPVKIETIKNKLIGRLKLSDDTFINDKIFLMKDGKVLPASRELFSPEYLYYNFHQINNFDPKNNNQGKVYQKVKVGFCLRDFVTLIDFNGFKTSDGKDGDMIEINWRFKSGSALLDFILYETYTNNFRNVEPPRQITTDPEEENDNRRIHGPEYGLEYD